MVESVLITIIYTLFYSLIGLTIIVLTLIVAICIILSKQK